MASADDNWQPSASSSEDDQSPAATIMGTAAPIQKCTHSFQANNTSDSDNETTSTEPENEELHDGQDDAEEEFVSSIIEEPEEPVPSPKCVVHMPTFFPPYDIESNWSDKHLCKELKTRNWLPDELKVEVMRVCYKPASGTTTVDNCRDMSGFAAAAEKLFPKHRVFASPAQLDQVCDMFLKSWGVKHTHPGCSIRCFYSPSIHKCPRLTEDTTKRRKVDLSPKSMVQCPFRINYTLVGKSNKLRKNKLFYNVKITKSCFEHTCSPSTTTHRMALKKSGGTMPSLAGVQGIITLLRCKPTLKPECLRPLLKEHIPWFASCDAKLIANFRRKALKFIYENRSSTVLTQSDVLDLTMKNSAANEMTIEDSPLARTNMKEILRTIMQETSDIWDAVKLLKQYQDENPGVDFRVDYCSITSKPQAICWMLPEMRADAIRYGDILFLDSQKRDMNTPGWPYIAPCIKDNEGKVRVIAECLCISESIPNYSFVLRSTTAMEPRFRLDKIKLIFADQFINQSLLEDLEISNSCNLHGDYFHLMNKVFPETFKSRFKSIEIELQAMISGDSDGWHAAFSAAHEKLVPYPKLAEALENIHSSPQYYSSWAVREIAGNLFCKGLVPAKQNHSSAVAHLGRGGNLSIAEHIEALFLRQLHLNTERRHKDGYRRVYRKGYTAHRSGQNGENDVAAKRVLSGYAFELYEKQTRSLLRCHVDPETGAAEFWRAVVPFEERRECRSFFLWDSGYDRCPCSFRHCLQIQCRHEFSRDRVFNKEAWSSRWLNDETYRADYAANAVDHHNSTPGTSKEDNDESVFTLTDDDEIIQNDDLDGDEQRLARAIQAEDRKIQASNKATYQSVMAKMEELARLVSRDQAKLVMVEDNITSMIQRLRSNASIKCQFINDTQISSQPEAYNIPVAKLGCNPSARVTKRLRSRHENAVSYRRRASKRPRNSNDEDYARENTKTKSCRFCRRGGHTVNHCPKITIYGRDPIKGLAACGEFVTNLNSNDQFHIDEVAVLPQNDIAESFPKSIKGMVIHSKKRTNNGRLFYIVTALDELGDRHKTYRDFPFSAAAITTKISQSEKFIVISFLRSAVGNVGDVGYSFIKPTPTSNTLTADSVSTLTQHAAIHGLSQGSLPGYVPGMSQIQFSQDESTFDSAGRQSHQLLQMSQESKIQNWYHNHPGNL